MQRFTRMERELSILKKEPPPGISCWSVDDQIDKLQAEILGSKETPYSGGSFKLEIQLPERYPFYPPKVRFVTKIYHPNIDGNGRICLDTLQMPPKDILYRKIGETLLGYQDDDSLPGVLDAFEDDDCYLCSDASQNDDDDKDGDDVVCRLNVFLAESEQRRASPPPEVVVVSDDDDSCTGTSSSPETIEGAWKPAWNISTVLTSIQLLMAEPNPEDPLDAEISNEFKYNKPQFLEKAKEWTQKYATGNKVTAASVKVSSSATHVEGDDSSDSDDDSSDEENAENSPLVHPTQGVKRAASAHLPRETKTLKQNNE